MNLPFDPTTLDKDTFVAAIGGVYEHSPWIAAAAFDKGLTGAEVSALCDTLRSVVEAAGREPQLSLLCAHPDLAGRLAKAGGLTAESTTEQASAGLDQCTDAEFAEFTALNDRYKSRFGFPFILAVRGRTRQEILENFRARVDNDPDTEFREALDQVHQIARLRLEAMAV